jgi:hypothetical protein
MLEVKLQETQKNGVLECRLFGYKSIFPVLKYLPEIKP